MAQSSPSKSGGTLSVRAGVSPKLLARKSAEQAGVGVSPEGIEASFPVLAPDLPEVTQSAAGASHGATAPATATVPPLAVAAPLAALAWSDEDESCFQALFARRRAARVPRVANSGTQRLQPGGIKPNPNTVVAVIVGLFGATGGMITLTREPSGRRASTIGDDSSTRRPSGATMRSMMRMMWPSSRKRTELR